MFHKKNKADKKDKHAGGRKTKMGHDQVIVPPGPAIVPAVVIPVVGMLPMNSPFNPGYAGQQQYGQYGQYGTPLQAPTSGILPPTGVQNPMTATLPINMQGLNPTSHLNGHDLVAQYPILSTPGCNSQRTSEIIGHQYPLNTSGTHSTYSQQPGYLEQPMGGQIKQTYIEERKEFTGPGFTGPGYAGRQF